MTPQGHVQRLQALPGSSPAVRVMETLAMAILLAVAASRPFLGEMTYRSSPVAAALSVSALTAEATPPPLDRGELSRMTYAMALLLAGTLWLAAGAARGSISLHHGSLAILIGIFAAWGLASALAASNRRWALESWIEQVSMLVGFLVAAQLCRDRRRLAMVVVVIGAVGASMAAKCFYEYFVELPERIAAFDKDPDAWIASLGMEAGSPQAMAMANRVRDKAAIGYINLSNVLASLLLVTGLTAAGLAAAKAASARATRRAFKQSAKPGEVHVATLAAWLWGMLAIASLAAVALTRSQGGIAAMVLALAAWAIGWRFHAGIGRHWKKLLLAGVAVLVLGHLAVVAYGIRYDGLPGKTLTFRWMYWTASARMVAENPLLGVGGGNFGNAYLTTRQVRAEESVKNPHNLAAQMLSEYGLPGGLAYLAVLALAAWKLIRPARRQLPSDEPPRAGPAGRLGYVLTLAAVVLAVLFARSYFADTWRDVHLWVLDGLMPAALLAMLMALAAWYAPAAIADHDRVVRLAMLCGLGGLLLYESVNFAMIMPASATLFWLAAGALLGQVPTVGTNQELKRGPLRAAGAWALAGGAAAGIVAVAFLLWWPVAVRTAATDAMERSLRADDLPAAVSAATRAAVADKLDPLAAADAARVHHALAAHQANRAAARQAYDWALEAIRRDQAAAGWQHLAAAISRSTNNGKAASHMGQAVQLDPQNLRMRLEFAQILLNDGRQQEAIIQLDAVLAIDAGLLSDSNERLRQAERDRVDSLMRIARSEH